MERWNELSQYDLKTELKIKNLKYYDNLRVDQKLDVDKKYIKGGLSYEEPLKLSLRPQT